MVYLLHFDRPYRHARHYVGATELTETELAFALEHDVPIQQPLLLAARKDGVHFTIARVWGGGLDDAVRLREVRKHKSYCTTCRRFAAEARE